MRILVVDDLEINRDLLARRVRRLGHEAGVANDGREALARLQEGGWDLVLLDITMPGMDGYEALQHIRAAPALAQLPVVMVSAIDETDSIVRCLELGADDYLTKPFNPVVLRARIEGSLAKKRLLDQQAQLLQALSREMEIGQRIQQGFLPAHLPALPGWSLAALCRPARRVGGDFYDAFALRDGRLFLAIADVCDKGVGAALYMALFRTLLRVTAGQTVPGEAPAGTLQRCLRITNDYIATEHERDHMFATAFVAIVEGGSGLLHYANAGHEPPLLHRAADGTSTELPTTGAALGLLSGQAWSVSRQRLDAGDALLAFTDGITEALCGEGPVSSLPLQRLLRLHGRSAKGLIDALTGHLDDRPEAHAADDDATVMALVREG